MIFMISTEIICVNILKEYTNGVVNERETKSTGPECIVFQTCLNVFLVHCDVN